MGVRLVKPRLRDQRQNILHAPLVRAARLQGNHDQIAGQNRRLRHFARQRRAVDTGPAIAGPRRGQLGMQRVARDADDVKEWGLRTEGEPVERRRLRIGIDIQHRIAFEREGRSQIQRQSGLSAAAFLVQEADDRHSP